MTRGDSIPTGDERICSREELAAAVLGGPDFSPFSVPQDVKSTNLWEGKDCSMPNEWYYSRNGEQKGPVNEQQLRALAKCGELTAADLVWCEGMSGWTKASSVIRSGTPADASDGTLNESASLPPPHPASSAKPDAVARSLHQMERIANGVSCFGITPRRIPVLIAVVLKWIFIAIGGLIMFWVLNPTGFGKKAELNVFNQAALAGCACFFAIMARLMQAEEQFYWRSK